MKTYFEASEYIQQKDAVRFANRNFTLSDILLKI